MNSAFILQKPKILVIDDESTLKYMAFILKPVGYDILLEQHGFQAVEKAMTYRPDVIFLDVFKSIPDGFKVCRHLKAKSETKNIPIVLNSTDNDQDTIMEAYEVGADSYLIKPFKHRKVIEVIEYFLLNKPAEKSIAEHNPSESSTGLTNDRKREPNGKPYLKMKELINYSFKWQFGFVIF